MHHGQAMSNEIDILEDDIRRLSPDILDILLQDHTTQQPIFWATDNYIHLGKGYQYNDPITPDKITGKDNGYIIIPRCLKAKTLQSDRTKAMAEVFTPSWMCNLQNNLIDEAWFGRANIFNAPADTTWHTMPAPIYFPENKTWQDYIQDTRLEITCGEGPYLVSRYDTTTGEIIPITQRIGIIDRKLRIVSENTQTPEDWYTWATEAYKATYGYEWQGDSLLLAREAMLISFIEYYEAKFHIQPSTKQLQEIADIISWNLWQMDGLKGVVPGSCLEIISKNEPTVQGDLFAPVAITMHEAKPCPGCEKNDIYKHTGKYCIIRDWKEPTAKKQKVRFIDTLK